MTDTPNELTPETLAALRLAFDRRNLFAVPIEAAHEDAVWDWSAEASDALLTWSRLIVEAFPLLLQAAEEAERLQAENILLCDRYTQMVRERDALQVRLWEVRDERFALRQQLQTANEEADRLRLENTGLCDLYTQTVRERDDLRLRLMEVLDDRELQRQELQAALTLAEKQGFTIAALTAERDALRLVLTSARMGESQHESAPNLATPVGEGKTL